MTLAQLALLCTFISICGAVISVYGKMLISGTEARLGGRIDVLAQRLDDQNGRVRRNSDDIVEFRGNLLDITNRLAHAQVQAAESTQALTNLTRELLAERQRGVHA